MSADVQFTPRLIAWELTRACPLACRHCRAAATAGPYAGELATDQCRRVIDHIAAFASPTLILTGGEPMLRADLYDLAAYAVARGLRVVLATCGALLDDAAARGLKACGVSAISISLDGATAATHDAFRGVGGAFDAALAAVAAARRGGLAFQINTTVTRANLGELAATLDLAARLGAVTFNPFLLVPTGRGRELMDLAIAPDDYERTLTWLAHLKRQDIAIRVTCAPHYQRILRQRGTQREMGDRSSEKGEIPNSKSQIPNKHQAPNSKEEQPPHRMGDVSPRPSAVPAPTVPPADAGPRHAGHSGGCLGGKQFAFISHTGKVQMCGFLDLEAGDLRQTDLDLRPIWDHSPLFAQLRQTRAYRGRCGRCEFVHLCGGCRARAYAVAGDFLGEEPFCTYQPKKSQIPNPKSQTNSKSQIPNPGSEPPPTNVGSPDSSLGFGAWDLFGIWNLEFGISSSDARLLTLLQSGLPLTAEPFAPLAQTLGLNIAQLLHRLAELKAAGLLRRLGAIFDSRALGYVTTLVAARVPDPRIDAVAAAVSDLAGVTHNYRRDHDYNLWFTLISESLIRQQETLAALSQRTGVQFFPLPAEKLYKLRVQFDLEASDVAQPPSAVPNEQDKPAANTVQPRAAVPHKTLPTPSPAASLDEGQKALIRLLQDDLPLVERPFDLLARQLGRPVEHVLAQLADWQKTGTLRRLGAILHHRALGFTANGMAVFDVSAPRLDAAGAILAARPDISHCYRRPPLPDFPYNLYAMIHGRSKPQVLAALEEILAALGPCPHAVLFSTRQYKKSSMRYFA